MKYKNNITAEKSPSKNEFCAIVPLEGNVLCYVPIYFSPKLKRKALTDIGACNSDMPNDLCEKIKTEDFINDVEQNNFTSVKLAFGEVVRIQY